MKKKPYPCLWLPVDCSIYDRGAHDQGCRHDDLEMIQLVTLLQVFQKNYPRFLVHMTNDGIFRVSNVKVDPSLRISFDISIVHTAFVVESSGPSLASCLAISLISEFLGPPQV